MNNELSTNAIKLVGSGILLLLAIILVLVGYSVLKPPVVNKDTIDALVTTAKNTETYVKELREIANQNRAKTNEDNDLLQDSQKRRTNSYQDLYDKYGIVSGETKYAKNSDGAISTSSPSVMRTENQSNGR